MGSQRAGHDWATFTHNVPGHCANQFIVNYTVKSYDVGTIITAPPPSDFQRNTKVFPMSWSGSQLRTQVLLNSKSRLLTIIIHIISQATYSALHYRWFFWDSLWESAHYFSQRSRTLNKLLPLQQISYQMCAQGSPSPPSILVPLQRLVPKISVLNRALALPPWQTQEGPILSNFAPWEEPGPFKLRIF